MKIKEIWTNRRRVSIMRLKEADHHHDV